ALPTLNPVATAPPLPTAPPPLTPLPTAPPPLTPLPSPTLTPVLGGAIGGAPAAGGGGPQPPRLFDMPPAPPATSPAAREAEPRLSGAVLWVIGLLLLAVVVFGGRIIRRWRPARLPRPKTAEPRA